MADTSPSPETRFPTPKAFRDCSACYCINLPHQADRLDRTRNLFSQFGISLRLSPGVLSEQVSQRITRPGVPAFSHGALQAHLQAFELALNDHAQSLNSADRPYIAIFEDDVIPLDTFSYLDDFFQQLPPDWDYVSLGGNYHYTPPSFLSSSIIRLEYAFNSHAQLIRLDFLPTLIKRLSQRDAEIDVIAAYMQRDRIGHWYGFTTDHVWQHALTAPYNITLWDHQLELFHFAKRHHLIDQFLIKGHLTRP